MKVLIEEYRGWEIHFDTDSEGFYSVSDRYDSQQNKPSYASAKKGIDDYIKQNSEFRKFKALGFSKYGGFSNKEITIIGIRKDGDFVYDEGNGKKQRLSSYQEDDYILTDQRNEPLFEKLKAIKEKEEELRKEYKSIASQVFRKTLKEIKKDYII